MTRNLNQGDTDVSTYFTSLSKLWQELDLADDFQWTCTEDCERFKVRINEERIYDFGWTHQDLDVVRSRTLAIKPLPKIEEVFAEVRREETRKRVMLGPTKTTVSVPSGDNSAIPVHGVDAARGDVRGDTS